MNLKLIFYKASCSSRMIKHLPHHPKVKGSGPTTIAGSKKKKLVK
jgi:hypothetical protein